jgi:hypothetical protein
VNPLGQSLEWESVDENRNLSVYSFRGEVVVWTCQGKAVVQGGSNRWVPGQHICIRYLVAMHSLYQRANGLTGLLSSCLIGLLALVALSSFLFPAHPKGDVNIKTLKV